MLKGCIIGLGAMGSNHARVFYELQEEAKIELIGVADIKEDRAKETAKKYGVDWFTDYKMLLRRKPDFVIVTVPTELHLEVALEAIGEGCHVLVEKPIAYTLEDGRKIVNAAKKKGVQLMVGHIERFNPTIDMIKERIGKEKILLIGAVRIGPTPTPERTTTGVIADLGVHDIDLIRYITGSEFQRIEAFTSDKESGMEMSAVLSFEMENGVLAYIITNRITPLKMRKIEVTTTKRFLEGDLLSQKVTEYSKGELISYAHRSTFVEEINLPFMEPLKLELKAFINSLKKGIQPPITGRDGLKAMEIAIECINQSRLMK
jgi:predicted dehydrogenase